MSGLEMNLGAQFYYNLPSSKHCLPHFFVLSLLESPTVPLPLFHMSPLPMISTALTTQLFHNITQINTINYIHQSTQSAYQAFPIIFTITKSLHIQNIIKTIKLE